MTGISGPPEAFRRAVAALRAVRPRSEVELGEVRPPQRLAPWSAALGAEVNGPAGEIATGRLVLLYDPEGNDAWDGEFRLVVYATAELDPELASDPLLPDVGWSWLSEALEESGAAWTALGGTVTLTSSARFGDIAGPDRSYDLELRASWTARDLAMGPHVEAFCALLSSAAGLPPEGVAMIHHRSADPA